MRNFFKSKLWGWTYMSITILVLTIGFIINNLIMILIGTIILIIIYYPVFKNKKITFTAKKD
jgi:type II secretory pathway component PulF